MSFFGDFWDADKDPAENKQQSDKAAHNHKVMTGILVAVSIVGAVVKTGMIIKQAVKEFT